jgi:hypothetical protein
MADELGAWEPLAPDEAARMFAPADFPWWIAGGWAIDLAIGRLSRPHDDLDIQVLRDDQRAVQALLSGWDLHAADPPGALRPWEPAEMLPARVHDIWCRHAPGTPWRLQFMLADTDGETWIFRRDPRIRRPIAELTRHTADGIPYLAPEVQLLYKSRMPARPKDEHDFAAANPYLDADARAWLRAALALHAPDHPWLLRL